MSLPNLDNHDPRIRYFELMLRGDITGMEEKPLPEGYHYETYRDGDRDAWIAIERSARELESQQQGVEVWEKYFGAHTDILPERMVFVVNEQGEKYLNAVGVTGYPFFGQLILDCLNRTENAMTQAHAFKAAELCLQAQKQAVRIG